MDHNWNQLCNPALGDAGVRGRWERAWAGVRGVDGTLGILLRAGEEGRLLEKEPEVESKLL